MQTAIPVIRHIPLPAALTPLVLLLFLALCAFRPNPSLADAASFITPEYTRSTGLAAMNAAAAYALGFTGKNVTVSVYDEPFCSPTGEFAGKYPYGYVTDKTPFVNNGDLDDPPHGVHISGIIAAAKNDRGMHGIAYDATLLPIDPTYRMPKGLQKEILHKQTSMAAVLTHSLEVMNNYPQVRINSQSVGVGMFVDYSSNADYQGRWGPDVWKQFAESGTTQNVARAAGVLGQKGNLMVWSAGNEGQFGPSVVSGLPSALGMGNVDASSFDRNWLSISSYDPRFAQNDPRFISTFTNLGQNASEYTLLAPGTDIYSTARPNAWAPESGTSMATPYASGAAALVQQAFPYMDGKQLADTLLSTATPMDKPGSFPEFFIVEQETTRIDRLLKKGGKYEFITYDSDDKGAQTNSEIRVVTYQGSSFNGKLTADQVDYYFEALQIDEEDEDAINALVYALAHPSTFSTESYRELFGQGIINVGKAVRGPGFFDAARLREADISRKEFADGKDYALYAVNTQGHDSVWSNDIGERRTQAGPLSMLGVGLRKDGEGTLHLTGQNSYTGPTEIRGGTVSLGLATQKRIAVIAGDVVVRNGGAFSGAGRVRGDLVNEGLLSPGYAGNTGSTLNVDGALKGKGVLRLALGENGDMNRITAAKADLTGTRFELVAANGAVAPYTDYMDAIRTPATVIGLPTQRLAYSAFIGFMPEAIAGRGVSLRADTLALNSLPGVPGKTQAVAGALQHLYDSLRGDERQKQLDFLYHMDRARFLGTAAAMRGDIAAATLTNLPFSGLFSRMVRHNPAPSASPQPPDDASTDFATASGDNGNSTARPFSIWLTPTVSYTKNTADSGIGQQAFTTHARGLAFGGQKNLGNAYLGALFAIGDGTVKSGSDKAEIMDGRVGLYGGWTPGAFRLSSLISGGRQYYDTDRYVNTNRKREHFSSRYHGWTFGLGLHASYNVLQEFTAKAALSPYLSYELDYIRQDSRREGGDSLHALDVKSKHLWRSTLEPGLALDLSPRDWLTLSASAGYKRLLNGHRPELNVGFKADKSYRFAAVSPNESRDFFTYSFRAEASLPHNVKLAARFHSDISGKTKSYNGSVNFIIAW